MVATRDLTLHQARGGEPNVNTLDRGKRKGIGLDDKQMLPIDGSSQKIDGCDTFGVNKLLPAYKDIYDEGKGLFIANMGHLHKPVTKDDWLTETRTDLFSHHVSHFEYLRENLYPTNSNCGMNCRL